MGIQKAMGLKNRMMILGDRGYIEGYIHLGVCSCERKALCYYHKYVHRFYHKIYTSQDMMPSSILLL